MALLLTSRRWPTLAPPFHIWRGSRGMVALMPGMQLRLMRKLLVGFVALGLGACATGPDYDEYRDNLPDLAPGEGRIFVYRTAMFGLANQPSVELNGETVGEAVPEGFFFVDVSPGAHTITCETEVTRSAEVEVEAGGTYYVRLNAKLGVVGNRIEPELVNASVGAREIRETRYLND